MTSLPSDDAAVRRAQRIADLSPPAEIDPKIEALVNDLIGRVADQWTMLILETLTEKVELRFTQRARGAGHQPEDAAQTLRQMERDGTVSRTVHAVVPPRVDYRLTDLGLSLGAAFCGVWIWAEENLARFETARHAFDDRQA